MIPKWYSKGTPKGPTYSLYAPAKNNSCYVFQLTTSSSQTTNFCKSFHRLAANRSADHLVITDQLLINVPIALPIASGRPDLNYYPEMINDRVSIVCQRVADLPTKVFWTVKLHDRLPNILSIIGRTPSLHFSLFLLLCIRY